MYILIYIGLFIASSVICHFIASNRQANAHFWAVMGLVFGPVAIPFAFFSKSKRSHK